MITRLLRISSKPFFSFSLELYSILSLSYSCTLRVFLEHSCRILVCFGFGERRQRKCKKAQGDNGINKYNGFSLQVPNCMYDFLASFGMHGICMWLFGYDLSLAWRIAWIDNDFS